MKVISEIFARRIPAMVLSLMIMTSFLFPASVSAASAPSFQETDIKGNYHSLEKYSGQTLVLYFWATWCGYCRKDVEQMKKVYRDYSVKGVRFLTVSLDQDRAQLEQFVAEKNIPYPVVFRGEGWGNKLAELYGISGIPTYFIIDPKGQIKKTDVGASSLDHSLAQSI